MTSPFCHHARVADRCHECEAEQLRRLMLAMAEKIFLMARHLGRLAEREEFRNDLLDRPRAGA